MATPHRLVSAGSIARAAAELVLIVAGILIALFLDSWWQERSEAADERAALAQIRQDLVEDSVDMMSGGVATLAGYAGAAEWFVAHRGMDIAADSAAEVLKGLTPRHLYQPQNSGYVGLRDSGRLDLIRNDSLRTELVRYYEQSQPELVGAIDWLGMIAEGVGESHELDWTLGVMEQVPEVGSGQVGFPVMLLRPFSEIPSDPRFASRVQRLGALSDFMIRYGYDRYFRQNDSLRTMIDTELNNR